MIDARYEIDGATVRVRSTDRSDGSFALGEPSDVLAARRMRVLGEGNDRRWVGLRQVHGAAVISAADEATATGAPFPEADAAVCFDGHSAVSVITADCAPVVLIGSTGVAAVHAGWRGAAAGVIAAAATMLADRGSEPVATLLGPCIQPAAYEFQPQDLEPVVALFGEEVVGETNDGHSALDLTRVVQLSCERAGWPVPDRPACTSGPEFFSHRTRGDIERQTTVAWIEP